MSSDDVEMDEILGGEVADAPSPCDRAMEIAALREVKLSKLE